MMLVNIDEYDDDHNNDSGEEQVDDDGDDGYNVAVTRSLCSVMLQAVHI